MDTVHLVGPDNIETTLVVEGVTYQVRGGVVTPDLPRALVPDILYGYGFHEAAAAEQPQED